MAKLTNCSLLLAVGFLMLFSPAISKAQNNPAKYCESGFELRWGWKYVWKNKANLSTGKMDRVYERDYVYDCFPQEPGGKPTNSTGENPVGGNSNSALLSEIRLSDLVGIWEGFYDKVACTLEIEKVDGDKFYGTLKRQGASVAVTGTINSKARSLNFSPAKIVTMDNTRDWRLGFNRGDFSDDGNSISGKGTGDLTTYEWSFVKKGVSSSNNRQSASTNTSWLDGVWEGSAYQTNANTSWTIKLTVQNSTYFIEYPSLSCGGNWTLINQSVNTVEFKEKITYGGDHCTDDGNVIIERISDTQVRVKFFEPNSSVIIAGTTLNKRKRKNTL